MIRIEPQLDFAARSIRQFRPPMALHMPPGPCEGRHLQGCCSGCCIKESLDFVVKLCRDLQNIRVAELRELR